MWNKRYYVILIGVWGLFERGFLFLSWFVINMCCWKDYEINYKLFEDFSLMFMCGCSSYNMYILFN